MAESLKVQLKDLMLKREEVEGDVALRSARLEAAGVGLHGSLVDSEVAHQCCIFHHKRCSERRGISHALNQPAGIPQGRRRYPVHQDRQAQDSRCAVIGCEQQPGAPIHKGVLT